MVTVWALRSGRPGFKLRPPLQGDNFQPSPSGLKLESHRTISPNMLAVFVGDIVRHTVLTHVLTPPSNKHHTSLSPATLP